MSIIVVGAHTTNLDGRTYPTPAGMATDIRFLLDWATTRREPDVTIIIPEDPSHGGGREGTLQKIRLALWESQPTQGAWFTCTRPGYSTVHIGIAEWVDHHDPLLGAEAARFAAGKVDEWHTLLSTWERLAGSHYRHTPGVAACSAIRHHMERANAAAAAHGKSGGIRMPRWTLQDRRYATYWSPPAQIRDLRYTAPRGQHKRDGDLHKWDTRSAYLAAAAAVELPYRQLTEDASLDITNPGYFRIQVASTARREGLGRFLEFDRLGCTWVTHSQARVLRDTMYGYTVIDAVAAAPDNARGRILRNWAERWRAHIKNPVIGPAIKAGYAQALGGLFAVPRGTIYRPDWRHLIMGQTSASTMRRIANVAKHAKIWPERVDVDAVYYRTTDPDMISTLLGVGGHIGNMRYEGISE